MLEGPDIDRLRLIRSRRIGPVTYRQLLQRFGSATAALAALPDLASRGGGKFTAAKSSDIEQEAAQTEKAGGRYLFLDSPEYPALLAQLGNAPAVFTWRGRLELLQQLSVAMVGARNASAGACKFARQLAYDLGSQSLAVVSGLARGIDTAAHVGSLKSGAIAVVAGGIDVTYPPENAELQAEIASTGLLIAEQPPGVEPRARHFPFRNRIIAGLAQGTVVVEAAPRSGSLITARLAAEAGREVMAIPGSPLDPRARGCNQLIREGATLVQDAGEIAELLRPFDERASITAAPLNLLRDEAPVVDAADGDRNKITDLLGHSLVSVDEIVRQSGAAPAIVQLVLLELELAGRLERGAGAKVRLTSRENVA
ncbi:MAG: DNA-processing protein DprA [Sphingorhabdus sp.]